MQFTEFKTECIKTESKPEVLGVNEQYLYVGMAMCNEVANFLDLLKKAAFYKKPLTENQIQESLCVINHAASFLNAYAQSATDVGADLDINFSDSKGNGIYSEFDFSSVDKRVLHAFIGSFTESGELLKALLISLSDGVPLDRVNVSEEYGDMDWYKAIAFDALSLSETASRNGVLAKLRKRYASGAFSAEAAINRDVAAEVEVLIKETKE